VPGLNAQCDLPEEALSNSMGLRLQEDIWGIN
jgi:hypothetical protein